MIQALSTKTVIIQAVAKKILHIKTDLLEVQLLIMNGREAASAYIAQNLSIRHGQNLRARRHEQSCPGIKMPRNSDQFVLGQRTLVAPYLGNEPERIEAELLATLVLVKVAIQLFEQVSVMLVDHVMNIVVCEEDVDGSESQMFVGGVRHMDKFAGFGEANYETG